MNVRLSSGKYDIIASGEAFLFAPFEDLTIAVDEGNEVLLKVVLQFREDAAGELGIQTNISEDALIITCTNFNSSDTGLNSPAYIANIDGKAVYLMFSSNFLRGENKKARRVNYTLFREK